MDSDDIIRKLKKEKWFQVRQKGSHKQFKHEEKQGRVTVTHPKKDVPLDTLKSIFTQAGWKWPP